MISVVFPCWNEEGRIGATLRCTVDYLSARSEPWEVVVVDDGSSDRTSVAVGEQSGGRTNVRVLRFEENHGKGWAVREGVRASRGELVLFSDADLSTPIESLERFEHAARDGYDLVIGSRVIDGARILTPQSNGRRLAGAVFRSFVHALGLSRWRDTQCGFKLLRRDTALPVLEQVETIGFAFDVELLFRAERAGLRIAELPVDWSDSSGSKVRLYPDALRMALDLVRLRATLRGA